MNMNKTIYLIIVAVALSVVSASARTLFVGHRGSLWGVENTREAFINGAKAGYDYIECDLRVAGDGVFVLSHDEATTRIGGNLTVAEGTLPQLRAERYTQTRGGETYSGSLCTFEEYLDICREYNVLPVIELKWATGINNNDCSNINRLIECITANGFRNKCIILTSMRGCLDYIHENHPDVKLQFLAKTDWLEQFDWCVSAGMDVDIRRDCVTTATVELFHAAGRLVNVWTVNDIDECNRLIEMGCDFITTDSIEPVKISQSRATEK